MPTGLRRLTLAVACSALALGATACGGDSSSTGKVDTSAATLVAAAPQRTIDAGTGRISFNVQTTALGQDITMTGSGLFDFAKQRGRLNFSIPSLLGDRKLTEIITGTTLYMQIPGIGKEGTFYKIDLSELVGDDALSQLGNADPAAGIEMLRGVSNDVEEVGSATVRGTRTKQYRGTIDTALALQRVPAEVRAKVQPMLDQLSDIPFEAFIDSEGRLRKLTNNLTLPASAATGDKPVTVVSEFEIYDFGTPVKISPPPKDRVVDGASLLGQLGAGAQ